MADATMASTAPPFKVRALYDYASTHDDDLVFTASEVITVTAVEDADWYSGQYVDRTTGELKQGIFPKNFVERIVVELPPRPMGRGGAKQKVQETQEGQLYQQAQPESRSPTQAPTWLQPSVAPTETAPAASQDDEAGLTFRPEKAPSIVSPASQQKIPPAPTSPLSKQGSKVPPPIAEKSAGVASSFRDRIAAFNKQTEPIKPLVFGPSANKPTSFIKKPFVAPPPSKNAYVPPLVSYAPKPRRDEETPVKEKEPEDIAEQQQQQPIKVSSLKDRIAMLQSMQLDPGSKPKPKPKPKPKLEHEEATPAVEPSAPASLVAVDTEAGSNTEPVAVRNLELEEAYKAKDISDPEPSVINAQVKKSLERRRLTGMEEDRGEESAGDADVSSSGGPEEGVRPKSSERKAVRGSDDHDEAEDEGENELSIGSQGEEEEEIDPEVARRMALRERMMKMSGGMGMHGMMFGPPPGLGSFPPSGAAKKRKTGESERRTSQDGSRKEEDIARSAPVPIFPFALPGSRLQSSKKTNAEGSEEEAQSAVTTEIKLSKEWGAEELIDNEDVKETLTSPIVGLEAPMVPTTASQNLLLMQAVERVPPPLPHPGPQERPAPPPPLHMEARPPTAQPPNSYTVLPSETEGSVSDDEASEAPAQSRSANAPSSCISQPEAPSSPTPGTAQTAPVTPGKRASYMRGSGPPPIPTGIPMQIPKSPPLPSVSRPPPPPPPSAPPPRRSIEVTRDHAEDESSEYEADYDTDLANKEAHKDALKAHHHHAGRAAEEDEGDDTPLPSPIASHVSSPRAVPPPPPTAPPRSKRLSVDIPRTAPQAPSPLIPDSAIVDNPPYSVGESEEAVTSPRYAVPPPPPHAVPPPIPGYQTPLVPAPLTPPPGPPPPPSLPLLSQHSNTASGPPAPPQNQEYSPTEAASRRSIGTRSSIDISRPSNSSHSHQPSRRSIDQVNRPGTADYIAREVDLSEHSQWWRYPGRIPPVFESRARDLIYEMEENTQTKRGGRSIIQRDIYVLFHDYSQTVVTARWDRDDPGNAALEQRHELPPSQLRQDQLEECHPKYGVKIYDGAAKLENKVVGDGDAFSLIKEVFTVVPDALAPIGSRSFGALVYANLANASVQLYDEIRPGDIISFRNAKFQGHKGGLHQKYTMEVGKPEHVAVVVDWDGTRKKLRGLEQGREKGKVKVESYKLGDLKSGEVKVWRVVGREWVGWTAG